MCELARMVVEREIPCRHLLAHVRRASRGHPELANTHPFTRTRAGRPHGSRATAARFGRFADFAAKMAALGPANFPFFDGETLFAHAHEPVYETATGLTPPRPPGLQVRHCAIEADRGQWRTRGARIPDLPESTVLLASVPLNDTGWQPLPRGHAMAIRSGELLHEMATL